jgi:hypothetical protein
VETGCGRSGRDFSEGLGSEGLSGTSAKTIWGVRVHELVHTLTRTERSLLQVNHIPRIRLSLGGTAFFGV